MAKKPIKMLHMSPADLESLGSATFGENWRSGLAEYLGISYSQIHRYMTLQTEIPQHFALTVQMLDLLRRNGLSYPDAAAFRSPADQAEPIARTYKRKGETPLEVVTQTKPSWNPDRNRKRTLAGRIAKRRAVKT